MNSLKNLQQRFTEQGEVNFGFGVRWWLKIMMCIPFGALCAGVAWVGISGAESAAGHVWAALWGALGFLLFAVFLVTVFRRSYRDVHRMRVTRSGIEMAHVRVPWQMVAALSTFRVSYRRRTRNYHTEITLPPKSRVLQAVWDDGAAEGVKLATAANDSRMLRLFTHDLNVRHTTLLAFLKWARHECAGPFPYECCDLNFERL
ncbi:hypothetical protein WG915_09240 [Corynebacterium sp. H128]|uniref:hypothetical protein n=1 Tax=Corynebacterium sp. H128 TaxID=3133427 RepID=UPI0030B22B26